MLIAYSASYFNCPLVLERLRACDEIRTSNPHAVAELEKLGLPVVLHRTTPAEQRLPGVHFPELFELFHTWLADSATDLEMEDWFKYFGVTSAWEVRHIAKSHVEHRQQKETA